jgi:hypothetical protein
MYLARLVRLLYLIMPSEEHSLPIIFGLLLATAPGKAKAHSKNPSTRASYTKKLARDFAGHAVAEFKLATFVYRTDAPRFIRFQGK